MDLRHSLKRLIYSKPFAKEAWIHCRTHFLQSPSIYITNFIFQRLLRINSGVPWSVHFTSTVIHGQNIRIGRNVDRSFAVSGGCYFQGFNGIKIGDETIFAPGVKLISANHGLNPQRRQGLIATRPIRIGKDCWLGANVVILPGVELGDNVVVGAGAVVTKSFPSNVILVGVPAQSLEKLTNSSSRATITI